MLIFDRTFPEAGDNSEFSIPNLVKLLGSDRVEEGTIIRLPLHRKKKMLSFYEMGGRNPEFKSSIATVVTGKDDSLPNAILFNKINCTRNGRQTFIKMGIGCSIYAGRVSTRDNPLAPTIRIIKLAFHEALTEEAASHGVINCTFKVEKIYTKYSEVTGNVPASRLVKKLFTDYVTRPFYVNGWSSSDLSKFNSYGDILTTMRRFYDVAKTTPPTENAEDFLDDVEQEIVDHSDKMRLSGVIQLFDFNSMLMYLIPARDLHLKRITKTILNCTPSSVFCVDILTFISDSYNKELVFDNQDFDGLSLAINFDKTYVLKVSNNVFGLIRAYRG